MSSVPRLRRLPAFSHFARRMLRQRGLLAGAIGFSLLSAGGLAAGLMGAAPLLKLLLATGDAEPASLRSLAVDWSTRHADLLGPLAGGVRAIAERLPVDPFAGVATIFGALLLLTAFGATANFLHQWCSLTLATRAVAGIRLEVFRHCVHLPLATVVRRGPAELVSRINKDSVELQRGFVALTSKALAQVTKGAAAFLIALIVEWRLTLVAIVVAPIVATVLRRFGKRIRRGTRGALAAQEDLLRRSNEALQGLRSVKSAVGERRVLALFARANRTALREELVVRTARAASSPIVETLAIAAVLGLALLAAHEILAGRLAIERFLLSLAALGVAGGSLKPLTGLVNDIQAAEAPAQRLLELLRLPAEGRRERSLPALPRHRGALAFEGISFRYGEESPWVLRDISLSIRHGESVAFVGPNGCGKTTLMSLLPRLIDPVEGRVLLDGVDLQAGSLRSLRAQIGVVAQESVLVADTIAENIRFGLLGADRAAIEEAARKAHADAFIRRLPQGYDTPVSEQGASLSGGQRQRIAIARAILRDPVILILDEATSQVDAESEEEINRAVREFAVGRTVLIVAHRLSTMLAADRIVVLDAGRVVGSGRHEELLDRCDAYRRLVRGQMVG